MTFITINDACQLDSECCGYDDDGGGFAGFDCVVIPGAKENTADMDSITNQFCGNNAGFGLAITDLNTVCSESSYTELQHESKS